MGQGDISYRLYEANKVASILFVDMVNSTELMAVLDIASAREYISKIMQTIEATVENFGGEVIKTQGDGIKAAFGHNASLEDHAIRSAYAALKIIRDCRKVAANAISNVTYQGLRVGIHSGYVILTENKEQIGSIKDTFGLTTHIAAKLQSAAPVDQVCLSETTRKLIANSIAAKRHKLVSIGRGISPIPSFTLSGTQDIDFNFGNQTSGSFIRLVGRNTELAEIEPIINFDNPAESISLLICGDAGIGKTKIIEEVLFQLSARSIQYTAIKGLNVMDRTPFFAVRQILRDIELNEYDLETSETQALSVLTSMDPIAMRNWRLGEIEKVNAIFKGALNILKAKLKKGPLVYIAEDLHFFDEESLRFLDQVLLFAKDHQDFRVIATSRLPVPKNHEKSFDVYQYLQPLSLSDAAVLVSTISKDLLLEENPEIVEKIVAHSGGNPLALTELTKLHFDETLKPQKSSVPVSIEPVLRKRIELLSPDGRTLANYLSLLGSALTAERAKKLTGWKPERLSDAIAETLETGILTENSDSHIEFGHDLYRITCSENLTARQRETFHRKIYNVLKNDVSSLESVPDIQMLARHAFGANQINESLDHFKSALSLANSLGGIRTVRRLFLQVCDYCDRIEYSAFHKARFAMLSFDATHRLAEEQSLLEIYLDALRNHSQMFSSTEIIVMKSQLAVIYWTRGEASNGISHASDAAHGAVEIGHFGLECITVYSLASLEFATGFLESAVSRIQKHMKKMPEELNSKKWGQSVSFPSIVLNTFGAWFAIDCGQIKLAKKFIDAAIKTENEFPNTYGLVLGKLALGYLNYREKEFELGAKVLTEAFEIAEKSALSLAPMSAARAVFCLIQIGDINKAQDILDREFKTKRYDIIRNANRGYLFLAKARLLSKLEKFEDAELWLERAIKDTNAKGDLTTLAYCYAAYPDVAAPTNGPDPERIRHLSKAHEIASECGMKPLAAETKQKLLDLKNNAM